MSLQGHPALAHQVQARERLDRADQERGRMPGGS